MCHPDAMSEAAGAEARILTARLELVPLAVGDADEMAAVLGDRRLHDFIGGRPATLEELRAGYARLVAGRSPDGAEEWRNWIVRLRDGTAVGTVQATITAEGAAAEIAWVVGMPWQAGASPRRRRRAWSPGSRPGASGPSPPTSTPTITPPPRSPSGPAWRRPARSTKVSFSGAGPPGTKPAESPLPPGAATDDVEIGSPASTSVVNGARTGRAS
jgi:hypothetical protein